MKYSNKREEMLDSRMAVHEDVCLRSCHGKSENGGIDWKELFLTLRFTSQEEKKGKEKKRKENSNARKGSRRNWIQYTFF